MIENLWGPLKIRVIAGIPKILIDLELVARDISSKHAQKKVSKYT